MVNRVHTRRGSAEKQNLLLQTNSITKNLLSPLDTVRTPVAHRFTPFHSVSHRSTALLHSSERGITVTTLTSNLDGNVKKNSPTPLH